MSLKSYLREVFVSWRSSHKSVPRTDWIAATGSYTPGAEPDAGGVYTAPQDGILVIQVQSAVWLYARKRGMDWLNLGSGGDTWLCGSVPCQKGDAVVYVAGGDNATGTAFIRFYPYVGS